MDNLQWDATCLPLKTDAIDVFISDLPFGKKNGSMKKNWQLYPDLLKEMARVCRTKTGRAVLLTKDKKAMARAYGQSVKYWRRKYTYWINIGGLQAAIYLLQRTSIPIH